MVYGATNRGAASLDKVQKWWLKLPLPVQNSRSIFLQMKDNSLIVWFDQVLFGDHLAITLAEAFNGPTSVLQRMGSMVLIQYGGDVRSCL